LPGRPTDYSATINVVANVASFCVAPGDRAKDILYMRTTHSKSLAPISGIAGTLAEYDRPGTESPERQYRIERK
jgi:hypothetical protein